MKSYYEILEVGPEASLEEVKLAYKLKLLSTHPDKQRDEQRRGVVDSIDAIKKAYETLSDPKKAQSYHEELQESFKKQGFSINGSGLDVYTLALFNITENGNVLLWTRNCPRCTSPEAMLLTEDDLENGTPDGSGGYQIMVQCSSCSLWITVTYEEAEEEED
uniref:Diphthamide biosynthesis protein 4 n=1 Tax=Candidozyma auris TaxID=498019 RepID=A0A0L0NRJ8_CANAR